MPWEIFYNLINSSEIVRQSIQNQWFNIILIEEGSGFIIVDGNQYKVKKHQAIVLFPGQLCTYELSKDIIAHHVKASKDIYDSINSAANVHIIKSSPINSFNLSKETFQILLFEIKEINRLLEYKEKEIIISRFRTCFLILKSLCTNIRRMIPVEAKNPTVQNYIHLVEQCFTNRRTIINYADELNVTPIYLNMLCKKHLNMSAIQLIHNRKAIEAKRLLLETELSVKEIAYELGFYNNAHFTRFFKLHSGFSPSDFKQVKQDDLRRAMEACAFIKKRRKSEKSG
ncbi:MAG: helix-turn-helix transcriptional regulator [Sphingobacterium sp.]|nr:helix-turn-helix transcriptional regulator [Sphingobacterium sp.]